MVSPVLGVPVVLLRGASAFDIERAWRQALDAHEPPLCFLLSSGKLTEGLDHPTKREDGHIVVDLSALIEARADGSFAATVSAEELLAPARNHLLAEARPSPSRAFWALPADARWEEMTFEFVAPQKLNVTFRGETRSYEPVDLGMRNEKNKKPTLQWHLLTIAARSGGLVSAADPNKRQQVRSQKKTTVDKLMIAFGMKEDPMPWDPVGSAYRTRFIVRSNKSDERWADEVPGW